MVFYIDALDFARGGLGGGPGGGSGKGRVLQEQTPVARFVRLCEGLPAGQDGVVAWSLAGREDAQGRAWLDVRASASLQLTCQRCLGPLLLPLDVATSFQLVASQSQLEALDALEAEGLGDDVEYLVAQHRLDVLALIEDELILAVPYVPRHEVCAADPDLERGVADRDLEQDKDAARPSPFAALARLKKY